MLWHDWFWLILDVALFVGVVLLLRAPMPGARIDRTPKGRGPMEGGHGVDQDDS